MAVDVADLSFKSLEVSLAFLLIVLLFVVFGPSILLNAIALILLEFTMQNI